MQYRALGHTGLQVSELVLGAATFGELCDEETVSRLVAVALDGGVNTFDTGDIYAAGRSEKILGAQLRSRRDQVVLCTKVGLRVGDTELDHAAAFRPGGLNHAERWRRGIGPNDLGLSRKHIVSAVEASLRRLGTDHIDLYQVHRWDPDTPIEESLRALDDLVRSGKVLYVGCSAFSAWQLCKALWVSEVRDRVRFASMQVPYNLLAREPERELLPVCATESVGVLAFQALAGGLLTGRYDERKGPEPGSRLAERATYRQRYWTAEAFRLVEELRALGAASGRTPGQLALGWVLARPAVQAAIVGAEEPAQLSEMLSVVEHPLEDSELAAMTELSVRS